MMHKPACPYNHCEGEAVTEVVCICIDKPMTPAEQARRFVEWVDSLPPWAGGGPLIAVYSVILGLLLMGVVLWTN